MWTLEGCGLGCHGGLARLLPVAIVALAALCLQRAAGGGGITDDERLLFSDGAWHRGQRKRVPFETSCYYTHERELPQGCQYSASRSESWRNHGQRAEERSVLLALYFNTGGTAGLWRADDNWGAETDPCWDQWYGVTCDEHGRIIHLDLSDNGLVGELP